MAAPHRPAAKAPTAEDCAALEATYAGLRTANEQLRVGVREHCRLMTAKMIRFPGRFVNLDDLSSFERRGFEGADAFESEWWKQAARRDGLFHSEEKLDFQLERLKEPRAELERLQSAFRCRINDLSRPYLRSLSILDLPDELLLDIFELVEGFDLGSPFLDYAGAGRRDIKNTRLVCRRFCDMSSQLLVRLVRVGFNEPSLARLDEISRHPTIAKGVRVVRVVLHFHSFTHTDIEWLIAHHADDIEEQVDMFDRAKLWDYSIPKQTVSELSANLRNVASELTRLVSADPGHGGYCEGDEGLRARLEETHDQYLALLEKQESLITSGEFARLVGSAIARMPGARKLDFDDADFESLGALRRLMTPGVDVWDALHGLMLEPKTGYHVAEHHLALPSYQCIVDVIDAVRSAGTLLNSIDIKLSSLGRPGALVLSPDIRQRFSSGMQQLKEFAFTCTCGDNVGEQGVGDLEKFLWGCLNTASLQKLSLDMRYGKADTSMIDIWKVMGSRFRHELTDIFLGQVATDLSTLVLFLERLPERMRRLHQERVNLRSGTWKEVLDALQEKRYRAVILSEPRGAECDDMSDEDYDRIFGKDSTMLGCLSLAELYISSPNMRDHNPLRALEDGPGPSTVD
ncbi:hypothetical protein C8A01DRAFT_18517 [Parachaetomium inaequale]|uniref:F-box domain-containing protein n=1 Tax=Parachaetomium inaequale TaxID=2588326 RepID=A0AAN6PAG1_9PEZI|nr:hypothetical protein C8A01DRAFT_18517 [Parachaetomium inaequale]